MAAWLVGAGDLAGPLEPWPNSGARSQLRRWLSGKRTPHAALAMRIAWWVARDRADLREPVCRYDAWTVLEALLDWSPPRYDP
jgi:hypothetical protein